MGFQSLDDCVLSLGVTPIDPIPGRWNDLGSGADRREGDHHAPHQRQIGDGLHILDAVSMMGDAHGPGEDHLSTGGVNLGGTVDLL